MSLPPELIKNFSRKELIDLWELADKCIKSVSDLNIRSIFENVGNFFNYEYALSALVDLGNGDNVNTIEVFNASYPSEWVDLYLKKSFQRVDPVVKNHLSAIKPQIWSRTYLKNACADPEFITMSNEFGLRDGASHGIKETIIPQSSIFSFSGINEKEVQRVISVLDIIVPHMHIALKNCYRTKNKERLLEDSSLNVDLSDREKEVLNWLKIGKTNWEISMIMKISERTAKFHVANIQKKLNSSTRGYAVAKAIQLELISL